MTMYAKVILHVLRALSCLKGEDDARPEVASRLKPEMGSCLCVIPEVDVSVLNLPAGFESFTNTTACYKFHGGSGQHNGKLVYQMEDPSGKIGWIYRDYLQTNSSDHCFTTPGNGTEPIWPNDDNCTDDTAINYACKLLDLDHQGTIILWKRHPSGVIDDGFAYNNVRTACNGNAAARSHYNCTECPDPGAPGGHVCLNDTLLHYIYKLHEKFGYIHVNEIAGACHSCRSVHYLGRAVDMDYQAGQAQYMVDLCNYMGGWGLDETSHVHCQFTT